ncbi:MAG: efflux RND transporter periplasmic adaptor subunit [Gemmataceae bacterium]
MRITRLNCVLAVAVSCLAGGCESQTPTVTEPPPPPVTVSQPISREVTDYDDYEGRIAAVDVVEVRARVRGHLNKVSFKDGQVVEKDALLFEIDPRPYKAMLDAAAAQKAAAEANLELAKKEYARIAPLVKAGASTREELDVWIAKQAVATAERLKAIAAVEQAQLELDFTKVTAPIQGKASRTQVTEGNLINASGGETLLTTIVSVDPVYVYFDVDERSLLRYRKDFEKGDMPAGSPRRPIKDLNIPIFVGLEGEDGYLHKGTIDFSDNRVNSSTGTIQVRGVLPNPTRILDAGMRARVRMPVGDPHKSLLVTERAVGNDQGRKFLYVVNDQNVVERRDVKLDRVVDGLQIVKEGLKPDDWVIVNGIQRARDAMKVAPKRSPMPGVGTTDAKTQPVQPKGKS